MNPIWHDSLADFERYLKAKGLSAATAKSYETDARGFLTFLDKWRLQLSAVDPEILSHYIQDLEQLDKQNSIRRKTIGIKQYFRFLVDSGLQKSNPLDATPIPERLDCSPDIDGPAKIIDALQNASTPESLKQARDQAVFCLLALEGLKVSEAIDLEWPDFLGGAQPTLRVPGKKARTILLSLTTCQALEDYRRHWTSSGNVSNKMILGFKGREAALTLSSVSRHGLKHMIYEYGSQIGLKKLNAEKLRHVAIHHLILMGKSSEEIMAHLGLRRLGTIQGHLKS